MKTKHFSATDYGDGKRLTIEAPDVPTFELGIEIDYDDVHYPTVRKQTKLLLEILEAHWPKE